MSQITEQIYVGSINEASNKDWLRKNRITHIVNAAKDIPNYFPRDFNYLRLDLYDMPQQSLYHVLEPAYKYVVDAVSRGGTVLIHCRAGVSRAASTAIYILMKIKRWDYGRALGYLESRRPQVNPNPGFKQQLISLTPTGARKHTTPPSHEGHPNNTSIPGYQIHFI